MELSSCGYRYGYTKHLGSHFRATALNIPFPKMSAASFVRGAHIFAALFSNTKVKVSKPADAQNRTFAEDTAFDPD